MKLAISAYEDHLKSTIDPRFGRAKYYLIVDDETLNYEAILNPNIDVFGGAGIQSAQLVINKGAQAVITGRCGPNAFRVLTAADIRVYEGAKGKVADVIQSYKNNKLTLSKEPGSTAGGLPHGKGMGRHRQAITWRHRYQKESQPDDKPFSQQNSNKKDDDGNESMDSLKQEIQDLDQRLKDLNAKLRQMDKEKKNSK